MPECYCVRCHSRLHVVGVHVVDGIGCLAIAFLCELCDSVWQTNVGWNRWLDRFDPEMVTPRYA